MPDTRQSFGVPHELYLLFDRHELEYSKYCIYSLKLTLEKIRILCFLSSIFTDFYIYFYHMVFHILSCMLIFCFISFYSIWGLFTFISSWKDCLHAWHISYSTMSSSINLYPESWFGVQAVSSNRPHLWDR